MSLPKSGEMILTEEIASEASISPDNQVERLTASFLNHAAAESLKSCVPEPVRRLQHSGF